MITAGDFIADYVRDKIHDEDDTDQEFLNSNLYKWINQGLREMFKDYPMSFYTGDSLVLEYNKNQFDVTGDSDQVRILEQYYPALSHYIAHLRWMVVADDASNMKLSQHHLALYKNAFVGKE